MQARLRVLNVLPFHVLLSQPGLVSNRSSNEFPRAVLPRSVLPVPNTKMPKPCSFCLTKGTVFVAPAAQSQRSKRGSPARLALAVLGERSVRR